MAPIDIVRARAGTLADFFSQHDREALRSLYGFSVVWQEQHHGVAALEAGRMLGAADVRIAASLAHVDALVVEPQRRRSGIGRRLLDEAADLASYYNCHKIVAMVPHASEAQRFFEACGYREEAVLRQHTFKLDVAVLRRFVL